MDIFFACLFLIAFAGMLWSFWKWLRKAARECLEWLYERGNQWKKNWK